MFMQYKYIEVWAVRFCIYNTLCLIIRFCFWRIFIFFKANQVKCFFTKTTITNILIIRLRNLKNQLILQFSGPWIIKVTIEILFAILILHYVYQYVKVVWVNFLVWVQHEKQWNVTCITWLLLSLLIWASFWK